MTLLLVMAWQVLYNFRLRSRDEQDARPCTCNRSQHGLRRRRPLSSRCPSPRRRCSCPSRRRRCVFRAAVPVGGCRRLAVRCHLRPLRRLAGRAAAPVVAALPAAPPASPAPARCWRIRRSRMCSMAGVSSAQRRSGLSSTRAQRQTTAEPTVQHSDKFASCRAFSAILLMYARRPAVETALPPGPEAPSRNAVRHGRRRATGPANWKCPGSLHLDVAGLPLCASSSQRACLCRTCR